MATTRRFCVAFSQLPESANRRSSAKIEDQTRSMCRTSHLGRATSSRCRSASWHSLVSTLSGSKGGWLTSGVPSAASLTIAPKAFKQF